MIKHFCATPWVNYSNRANGYIRVCCFANQGPTSGILRKENGSPYTYKDKINDTRNCQLLKDIRKSILNGEWHPECIRCKREQNSKANRDDLCAISSYEYFNEEDAIKHTSSDGSIDVDKVPIYHYDLRFGNKCNLRCRMCYATDSDGWYRELEKVYRKSVFEDLDEKIKIIYKDGKYIAENDPYGWHEEDIFWENILEHLDTIKLMYIIGGEPMLINRHFDFLEECIKTGNSKRIDIGYNTNLTTISDRGIDIWKKFNHVHFGVSIDAIGIQNNYLRYPSKWEVIERNLKKIQAGENFTFDMATTVSVFNIFSLVDIIKWGLNNIRNDRIILKPHPLHGPKFFNVKIFPQESKEIIENHLLYETEMMKSEGYSDKVIDQTKNCVQFYINFMKQEDIKNQIGFFWKINDRMDYHRNQNLKDFIPELIDLLPRYV